MVFVVFAIGVAASSATMGYCRESYTDLQLNVKASTGVVQAGETLIYKVQLGAVAQALSVRVTPKIKENDFVVSMASSECPDHSVVTRRADSAPENTEESALNLFFDDTGTNDYEVGVNAPHLVQAGEWFISIANVNKPGAPERHFTVEARSGAATCSKPTQLGDLLCGRLIGYPVLAVQVDTRNQGPDRLSLPTTDPQHGVAQCRRAAMSVWCQQVFPKCDPITGVAVQPCANSCEVVTEDCGQLPGMTDSVKKAVCLLEESGGFHSPFTDVKGGCMAGIGITGDHGAAPTHKFGAASSLCFTAAVTLLITGLAAQR